MPLPINYMPQVLARLQAEEEKKKAKEQKSSKNLKSIEAILKEIQKDVEEHLLKKKDKFRIITDYEELKDYFLRANKFGKMALDTETTGLDVYHDKIVGFSCYFPGEKAIYVPINHVNYLNHQRYESQLTELQVRELFKLLTAKLIFHNAPFDIRVILHTIGVRLYAWWDVKEAAFLLYEEESHALKDWHGKYISHEVEKDFRDLFGDISFSLVPVEFAYLYAANDALDTYECFEFQEKFLNDREGTREDFQKLYWVFRHVEVPMIEVIIALEENGVAVDKEILDQFKVKYHKREEEALKKCREELDKIQDKIDEYKFHHPLCGLGDPINVASTEQLAILFYDILHCKPVEGKKERCLDSEVLATFEKTYDIPVIQAIIKYRKAAKLNSTYIDKIYDIMDEEGRVHTGFNSNGAVTGRMSSKEPINLQNIPGHGEAKEIRKMYRAPIKYRNREIVDNVCTMSVTEEVKLQDGSWKWAETVQPGDVFSDGSVAKNVKVEGYTVYITV